MPLTPRGIPGPLSRPISSRPPSAHGSTSRSRHPRGASPRAPPLSPSLSHLFVPPRGPAQVDRDQAGGRKSIGRGARISAPTQCCMKWGLRANRAVLELVRQVDPHQLEPSSPRPGSHGPSVGTSKLRLRNKHTRTHTHMHTLYLTPIRDVRHLHAYTAHGVQQQYMRRCYGFRRTGGRRRLRSLRRQRQCSWSV